MQNSQVGIACTEMICLRLRAEWTVPEGTYVTSKVNELKQNCTLSK